MFRKIYLVLLIVFFNSCILHRDDDRELIVKNSSQKTVFSILSENDNMNNSKYYYEYQTGWMESYRGEYDQPFIFEEIKKGETIDNHDTPVFWDDYFERLPDRKARLFIVQKDSVDKYGWKAIFKKNIYNKKYYLTLEDLDMRNWEIVYRGE